MNPVLQEILHNITTRLAALEESAQSEKLLVDLIQEQRAEIDRLRQALAQPEHMTPISPDQYERLCFTCGACTGKPWVGLTDEEAQDIAKRLVDDVAYCSTHYAIAIEVALRKKNERN